MGKLVIVNLDQIKKNVWSRIQLVPVACRLDQSGRELPSMDDDWIIEGVSTDGVRISNSRTGHTTNLGKDHIHHFTTNPDRSQHGVQHGFFTLNVQIFLQGNDLWVLPNARPGEPVKPQASEVVEKWVDVRYPFDSGLQGKLEAGGYRVAWCADTKLSRKVDLEGWEIVVEPNGQGVRTKFRLEDRPANQTLIKRRNG
jgi:hypothetical protein